MKAGISVRKIWSDEDLIEFEIKISDGISIFCTKVYAGHQALVDIIGDLGAFRNHLRGGLCDITLGKFGQEYAAGAFCARLHFHEPGKLAITVHAESEWRKFKKTEVASNATLYLSSEPVLLDNFIAALKVVQAGASGEAALWSA